MYDYKGGQDAVREETAAFTNEMETRLLTVNRCAGHDEINADSQEDYQRQHFDKAEPEFQLTENLDREQVHRQHEDERGHRKHPLVDAFEPWNIMLEEIHVERDCGHIRNRCHGPVEPVHPASRKGHLLAVEFTGIGDEGAGARAMHDQLAKGAQHQKCEKPQTA